MKRLLITGAEGFTGRHLVDAAVASGFDVTELKSDLTNAPALEQEILAANPTHVVHLAAISAVTHADQSAFYQVNLFGTLNLLNALIALPTPPEKVLLASSANVYGNQIGEISEAVCPKPVNHYATSKLAMEHMAMTYADRLPLLMVRPFNYTGVGHDQRFVIPKIVDHFKRGAEKIELGNLEVYREYNDVRMVCDVYLRLLEKGQLGEIYNVCSGRAFSLGEVIALAEKLSGQHIEVSVNPMFVRANEVHTLSGNAEKLESAIGHVHGYSLENTLAWMLASN
jgi:nucleoside-diphosphate-sugar epimerase